VSRQYRTDSGTYTEEELAVVVWVNPKHSSSKQARFLETMTTDDSTLPMAFPLNYLMKNRSWRNAVLAHTGAEVFDTLQESRRSRPLVIPLKVATEAFGWENFYIPTQYTV
jgi:heme oxygenase